MTALALLFGTLIGACAGSFLSCAAWRLPRRESLNGRSYCPACGQHLAARHNLPLLGYLALRGRSTCCRQPIPLRYLLFELAGAGVGAGLALAGGPLLPFAALVALAASSALLSWLTRR